MNRKKENNAEDLLETVLENLRKNEPQLKDNQEIAHNVMQSIQHLQQRKFPERISSSSPARYLIYAQRLLTAASVCLLILYGIEEFTIVNKMNTLENQTAAFKVEPARTISRRLAKNSHTFHSLQLRFPGRLKFFATRQYLSQDQTIQSLKTSMP